MNTRTYPLQQHGVHVQEINREDPGGLGAQELPPGRAGPARRRIDARGTRDLPHRGRRNTNAELDELAVDPPVSPQRILPRQTDDKADGAQARSQPEVPDREALASLAEAVELYLEEVADRPGTSRRLRWRPWRT
jgi:hypothetical protein